MPHRHVRVLLLVLLVLVGCARATLAADRGATTAPAPAAKAPPPSNTNFAERVAVLSVHEDSEMSAANGGVALLNNPAVIGPIASQLLGIPADQVDRYVKANAQRGNDSSYVINLRVDLSTAPAGTRPAAQEVADALVDRLRAYCRDPLAPRLQELDDTVAKWQQRLKDLEVQTDDMQQQIRGITGRVDVAPESIRGEANRLEEQREVVRLDLEAKQARQQALAKSIADLSEEIAKRAPNDPVAAELQKVVDAKHKETERIQQMVKQGVAPTSDADAAASAEAEARAKLMERRAAVAESAGGETLTGWNHELRSISVDTAELQARLKALTARLDAIGKSMPLVSHLESMEHEHEKASASLERAQNRLEEFRDAKSNVAPLRLVIENATDRQGPVPDPNAKQE